MLTKLIGFMLLIFNTVVLASDGGVDGGGGNGVVCRDSSDSITSVRMLDLYEGEILYSLQFSDSFSTVENALKEVSQKMHAPHLEYMFLSTLNNFKMLPTGVRLKPINDSGHIFIPSNCKIEQVANYYNSKMIYVVSDFYNKMSLTDKVGLIVHETLYYMDRLNNVTNSRYSRRVTAHALSDNFEFEAPYEDAPIKKGLFCTTPIGRTSGRYIFNPGLKKATGFWAIPSSDPYNNWRFQFTMINGHTVYSKTYLDVDIDEDFSFPLELIENKPSTGNGILSTGSLISKLDINQSIVYELKNDEVNLDLFTGPTPTPGPWMDNYSSNYMYLSWTGFDPGDKFEKVQFVCTEITIGGDE